jgi:hypothetical protein
MEIVIALDIYDDLYSDFDIRGYGERAISRDFLDELHIRLRRLGTEKRTDIVLLVPTGTSTTGEKTGRRNAISSCSWRSGSAFPLLGRASAGP